MDGEGVPLIALGLVVVQYGALWSWWSLSRSASWTIAEAQTAAA